MGQYHYTVNLDKKEFLHPHKLGSGLKLWEFAGDDHGIGCALSLLLACSNGRGGGDVVETDLVGRWAGDRIAIVGDYAEDGDLPGEFIASGIYQRCDEGAYLDISESMAQVISAEYGINFVGDGWKKRVHVGSGFGEPVGPEK